MIITFTNTQGVSEEHSPKPASAFIPEWYKNQKKIFEESQK